MVGSYGYEGLPAGMYTYVELWWRQQHLEDYRIDVVEEIEFSLYASDEDWINTLFRTDIITLKP